MPDAITDRGRPGREHGSWPPMGPSCAMRLSAQRLRVHRAGQVGAPAYVPPTQLRRRAYSASVWANLLSAPRGSMFTRSGLRGPRHGWRPGWPRVTGTIILPGLVARSAVSRQQRRRAAPPAGRMSNARSGPVPPAEAWRAASRTAASASALVPFIAMRAGHAGLAGAGGGRESYGTFQFRPASLRTCGMNESVICSAGCGSPPTLNCTVPQAAGPCATASGRPPALARNVSRIPPPGGAGHGGGRPDSGQLQAVDERREPPDNC
jgi:hypothetical protein